MSEGPDDKARQHRRYEVSFDVEITAGDWEGVLELSTQNISRGGLFVRSMHPVKVGARLKVTLRLPDGEKFNVEGEVAHTVSPEQAVETGKKPGFGLRFDDKHALDLSLLEAMAASHTGGRHCYSMSDTYIIMPTVLRRQRDRETIETTAAYQLIELGDLTSEQAVAAERDAAPPPAAADDPVAASGARGSEPPSALAAALALEDEIPGGELLDDLGSEPLDLSGDPAGDSGQPAPVSDLAELQPSDSGDFEVSIGTLEAPAVPLGKVEGPAFFGIDFGTSYTSIALLHDDRIRLLSDDHDQTMIPTVVCYREGDSPLVGWPARGAAPMHPTTTLSSPKRLLGRNHDDRAIAPYLGSSAVETSAGPNGQVVAEIHGEQVAIPQVCAEVFRELARIGERATGARVQDVVLSAPVTFGEPQLIALRRAAELAGLRVLKIVDEPVAAAVAFGRGRQTEIVAVYDFGGGTFDFTLLEIADRRFRVMARAGDGWLGGDDFDNAIAEHVANRFWRETEVDLHKRQVEWQQLLMICEEGKRRLSSARLVELLAPGIVLSASGPVDLRMPFDRDTLDEICGPLVDRSLEVVERCLREASFSASMIDQVVLTGGVTRMPLVRERVQDYFEREIGLPVNPEHAVVIGDAIYANHLGAGRRPELSG